MVTTGGGDVPFISRTGESGLGRLPFDGEFNEEGRRGDAGDKGEEEETVSNEGTLEVYTKS